MREMENRIEQEIRGMDRVARTAACRYVNRRFEFYDLMLQSRKNSAKYRRYERLQKICYMHYYRLDAMYGPQERRTSSLNRWDLARLDLGLSQHGTWAEVRATFYG